MSDCEVVDVSPRVKPIKAWKEDLVDIDLISLLLNYTVC